jgi:hypothetical protein
MNKPLTMVHADFKQELADLINRSGLPAFVVEYVLQDYLNEIKALSKRQYQLERAEYEKSLANSTTAKELYTDDK